MSESHLPRARWGIGASLVLLAVHLATLTVYPRVMIDEAWNANTAWGWLTTGVPFDSMHAGTLDRFGAGWVRRPYLGTLPWVISFAVSGLGLAQARFVSWIFGVALTALTFLAGRRLYGPRVGALAALLLVLSPAYVQASHWARQDVVLAVVVVAAFLVAKRALAGGPLWLNAAAGLVLGLGVDVHQNALLFAPGLGALYLVEHGRGVLVRREIWLCALGGALGVGAYLAAHVLPNPEAYQAIFRYNFTESHVLPILNPLGLPRSFYSELGRFGLLGDGVALAMMVAAVFVLARRRSPADHQLMVFSGSAFLCFGLFAGSKLNYYGIQLTPFFALAIAASWAALLSELARRGSLRVFAVAVMAVVLLRPVLDLARGIHDRRGYDYERTTELIRDAVPPGARLMALPTWWLGLSDLDYTSTLNLRYEAFYSSVGPVEALATLRPDVLVVEAHTRAWLRDWDAEVPVDRFLDEHGRLLASFEDALDPWHGHFEVFELDWPTRSDPRSVLPISGR